MTTDNQIRKILNKIDKTPKNNRVKLSQQEIFGLGYKPLLQTQANFIVMKGSRNSKKSVNNFRRAVLKLLGKVMGTEDPDLKCNVLVIRKYLTDHSGSTRKEIVKAIKALGLTNLFHIPKSELTITYKPKGTCFFFRGMDDVQSITSITCEEGYITDVIFEEAFQITNYDDVDKVLWSIRALPEPYYPQFMFMFNSWNEEHWLNEKFFKPCPENVDFTLEDYDQWKLAKDTDGREGDITRGYNKWCEYDHEEFGRVLVGTCNFMDNEFVSELDLKRFDRLRNSNPDQFKVIGLGNWGVTEGNVFTHWKVKDFDIMSIIKQSVNPLTGKPTIKIFNGLDFGFSTSPTCFVNLFVDEKNSIIYINSSWEQTGLTNPQIAAKLRTSGFREATICCDAAEPKSILELRHQGIWNARAGDKLEIRDRIQLLKSYHIWIHPSCTNVIEDFKNCIYDTDPKTGKPRLPERWSKDPSVDPHSIDAISYALGKLHKGGLSFD